MTKDIRKQLRFTESTKTKLTWLSEELGINESAVVDLLISEKYKKLKENTKMKKATLRHDDFGGWRLVGEDQFITYKIDCGENPDEPDWDLVERQANALGYTLE